MLNKPEHWQRLSRDTLVDTRFIKVYQDKVQLPTGDTFDDYTVATLPSGVVIVATDEDGKLITQFEYKYAIDKVILNLPSGSVEGNELPLEAAAKELLEETGYVSEELELIQTTYEYPSKLNHLLYIVRAKNARKVQEATHEATESISEVHLIDADMPDYGGIFDTTYNIAALALTLPEFLRKN
jgi:ADP-ribose pyrophosphatase